MRTFRLNAPIIIGAGAFLCLVLALAPLALKAGEQADAADPAVTGALGTPPAGTPSLTTPWVTTISVEPTTEVIDTESDNQPVDFAGLRAHLDSTDRELALNALQVALSELGDGGSLVWKRESRGLTGVIKPVSAFRDASGRICRHLTYSLTLGTYAKEVEGIACRESDGKWSLQG